MLIPDIDWIFYPKKTMCLSWLSLTHEDKVSFSCYLKGHWNPEGSARAIIGPKTVSFFFHRLEMISIFLPDWDETGNVCIYILPSEGGPPNLVHGHSQGNQFGLQQAQIMNRPKASVLFCLCSACQKSEPFIGMDHALSTQKYLEIVFSKNFLAAPTVCGP